jgi:hypothetical protein
MYVGCLKEMDPDVSEENSIYIVTKLIIFTSVIYRYIDQLDDDEVRVERNCEL